MDLIKKKSKNVVLFAIILFISLSLYCASKNGYLPLVHGPYYFSIAKSLFHYNAISHYAIYPSVQSLVYTLQIGISFFEYLLLFISKEFWFVPFYTVTSLIWILSLKEFLNFKTQNLTKADKYLLFFLFFFQPYNLNQLANFSNESLYFPLLLYFYFSFFRITTQKNNYNYNYIYIFLFTIFVFIGVFFRLHHAILCLNFFIFAIFLRNKKLIIGLFFIGILDLIFFGLIIKNTYLNVVFFDHLNYVDSNIIKFERSM